MVTSANMSPRPPLRPAAGAPCSLIRNFWPDFVALHVVHDQGAVVGRHPAGDALPHVQGEALHLRSLGPQGDLEVQLVVLGIQQQQ